MKNAPFFFKTLAFEDFYEKYRSTCALFQVFKSPTFLISDSHPVPVFLLCVRDKLFFIYPTKLQYIETVKSLFKRFPSLTEESVNYNDAVDLWHGRPKNHFKSQRFGCKENIPEIILKRQLYGKRKSNAYKSTELKRKKLCWGMENFVPDLREDEEDTAYSRYQRDLKEHHNLRKESCDK